MASDLVHVGFGSFVAADRILGAQAPTSAPIQRLVREAKITRSVVDLTSGRRTKAVVFMDNGILMLIAISPEALASRIERLRVSQ
jgi:extracellular matrix regulatory protein A